MKTVKISYKIIKPELLSRFIRQSCGLAIWTKWKRVDNDFYEITFCDVENMELLEKFLNDFI